MFRVYTQRPEPQLVSATYWGPQIGPVQGPPRRRVIKATQIKTPEQWRHWLRTAAPGARACYWHGQLGKAREGHSFHLQHEFAWKLCKIAEQMGALAWEAHSKGQVYLTQARAPVGGFLYLATKASRPRIPFKG
jgi:hypothetical protein